MRKRLLVALGTVFALGAVTALLASRPRVSVSRSSFDMVRKGMSREQVQGILGAPPSDYSTEDAARIPLGTSYWDYEEWTCDEAMLLLRFDQQGRVDDVVVFGLRCPERSFLKRLCDWLGWAPGQ
jgi:outer membrane protein assembly factor BamE (lipoprotein component of BamABCDE complex)